MIFVAQENERSTSNEPVGLKQVYKYSFYPISIVAWNKLPVTTDMFPFTNGVMPRISSMIGLLQY